MKFGKLLIIGAGIIGIIALLGGVGYWYVFMAGAPQLDPPPTTVKDNTLTFSLQTFNSKAMGEARQYDLILPPGYKQNPKKRYPVIFLLHGGHDDANAWVKKIGIIPVLDSLYKSGKLPPSIVIAPDGNDKRGSSALWDPQYFDGPNGNVGTLIGSELVQVVKSRYRALESPQFWAIGGLSSGGWVRVTLGCITQTTSIFSLVTSATLLTRVVQNSPQDFVKMLPVEQQKRLRIYVDAGKDDLAGKEFLESTQSFHETLNALNIENEFHVFPGGHGVSGPDYGWNYDHKHSFDSLSFVGRQFRAAMAKQKVKQ